LLRLSTSEEDTLGVNACIPSITGYLQDAIDARTAEGHQVSHATIAHTSPAIFEVVKPYGTLSFDASSILGQTGRRPLQRL